MPLRSFVFSQQRWPLPALRVWLLAWALFWLLRQAGGSALLALLAASVLGLLLSLYGQSRWRRALMALGFPLALLLANAAALPAWAWLLPLLLLLLLYPVQVWRDAPLFPTPANALRDLDCHISLPPDAKVLDAGCGLGHGLRALHRLYPDVQLHGIEWSALLRWLCARRCRWAQVRRGDFWHSDWRDYDLVYLFQRPESMLQAAQKARAELRPGAWLVSLDFAAETLQPLACLRSPDGRALWLYQAPLQAAAADAHPTAIPQASK